MKSRNEFGSNEDYVSYLRAYFSIRIYAALLPLEYSADPDYAEKESIKRADKLIKHLGIK